MDSSSRPSVNFPSTRSLLEVDGPLNQTADRVSMALPVKRTPELDVSAMAAAGGLLGGSGRRRAGPGIRASQAINTMLRASRSTRILPPPAFRMARHARNPSRMASSHSYN